ncbi:copper resistance protein CopC [Solwaraspora sp. WMMD791]|uniref:copper resistance CopC family protein n=1 Tax=Solwaraspora sp. WMMD791 TaxID=3016086 RepID=UPI00249BCA53|nr:copper resistance CopC family protein [Solwaraspora sp. WMMD791]WFE24832.1 copper resistance protein CopC [Solwaraspora sp. WMMD791]
MAAAGAAALAALVGLLTVAPGPAHADDRPADVTAQPAAVVAQRAAVAAEPVAGAVLAEPPTAVSVTFGDTVQPELSHLDVFDADGRRLTGGGFDQPTPTRIRLPVELPAAGDYTVAYHVTFPDGSSASDAYRFSVGTGVPPAPLAAADRQARVDEVSAHAHQIDGFSATLLIIDGVVLLGVILMLWLRPRDGRPMTYRPDDPD